MVCQTAHPRNFFGERDCAACKSTDSFSDVIKQSMSDQDSTWPATEWFLMRSNGGRY